MASQVEIVNLALLAMGEFDFILSMTDQTKSARLASLSWETAKTKVLEDANWKFATKRTNLAPLSTTPSYEYSYQFQLPTDLLQIIEVSDGTVPVTNFEKNGRKLLCNLDLIYLKYVYNVTDTSEFSPSFVTALSLYLAYLMAYSITSNRSLAEGLFQQYTQELRIAKQNDAATMTPKENNYEEYWSEYSRLGDGLISY